MTLFRQWCVGRIVPAIVALVFVADIAARFLPIERLTFRAWEALVRFPAPCGHFRANASYDEAYTYGDLAALGNMPQHRIYRREVFTTDHRGFRRNARGLSSAREHQVIVLGDSMVVGSSVNDEETLVARLEQGLSIGVYNAGTSAESLLDVGSILELARSLKMAQGTVLYQHIGRTALPSAAEFARQPSCNAWRKQMSLWYTGWVDTSPLKIVAEKTLRYVLDDSILPNAYQNKVIKKTFTNGDAILFYRADVANYGRKRSVDVRGIQYLSRELHKHGFHFGVILVPDKYAVYEPLLVERDRQQVVPIYQDLVEQKLKENEIPVVNLTGFLRNKAVEYYSKGQYLYWRDDTHWNAEGIKIAAEEILRQQLIANRTSVAGAN